MLFQNGPLTVRLLEHKDQHLLAKWLSDPIVLEFYEGRDNPFDLEKVNQVFYTGEEDEVKCIIEFDDVEIGYIQYYLLDDDAKQNYGYQHQKAYGMDQFIGEVSYWNKGIGTKLVASMAHHLFDQELADVVVMDPQIRNARALSCYEKCGFQKVKILPNHELHEGEYQDCWLIEYRKKC
jgi:aminoglycoside 6'-N-acetyltransferase